MHFGQGKVWAKDEWDGWFFCFVFCFVFVFVVCLFVCLFVFFLRDER